MRSELTQLLHAWNAGDQEACAQLMALAYEQVRRIAENALRGSPGATLTPTELCHEALIKLLGATPAYENRKHFFGVIAKAVRQVLVDAARKRLSEKSGAQIQHVALTEAHDCAEETDTSLLKVDMALADLFRDNPRRGEVVELVYFGGFTQEQVAESLSLSLSSVERDLRFARAWLKVALSS
jgi:RNA polymerase sigma-70 factor, ECF subfamily